MTNEQEDTGLAVRFRAVRFVLLAALLFLLTATLLIGGLAWLLNLTGIGLSLDTRFLMATMIFCTMVVATTAILFGAAIVYRIERVGLDESQPGDARGAGREFDEEEIANRVVAKIFYDGVADDFVRNRRAEESTAKPRPHSVKSAGSRKRR